MNNFKHPIVPIRSNFSAPRPLIFSLYTPPIVPLLIDAMSLHSIFGVVLGFAAHRIFFIKGEWHVQAPTLVASHIVVFLCLHLSAILTRATYPTAILNVCVLLCYGYIAGLALSIVIYRLFFHRLTGAGFPGPWYAPISNLWNVWASRDGKYYLTLHALHQKYGDFVRTGKTVTCHHMNLRFLDLFVHRLSNHVRFQQVPPRLLFSTRTSLWPLTALAPSV